MLAELSAQLDTHHFIPPMYGRQDLAQGSSEDIYLMLSTPQETAFDVTITDGAGNALFTGVSVSRSAPVTLSLSSPSGASKGPGTTFLVSASDLATVVSKEGLLLTANKAFFASIRVDEGAQAASLTSKGTAGLGTEFRTGHMWNVSGNPGNVDRRKSHVISFMASEDNTNVTVSDFGSVDFENVDESSGSISVNLNKGQSYVLAAHVGTVAANLNDVNGTRVTSDKPIVVNSGTWLGGNPINGNGQGRDIGIDQIASLEETGFEYILIKGEGDGNENVVVVASIDGTQVFLNGSTTSAVTLNSGDYHRFTSSDYTSNENMHLSSNQPIYVYQTLNGSNSTNERQNGLNFIPPIVCLGGTNVDMPDADFTRAFGGSMNGVIQVIAEVGQPVTITDENGIVTDISGNAKTVTGNPSYVTYKERGYAGDIRVQSPRPIRVALTIESGNIGAAGFFSGFTTAPVVESPNGYDAATCIPDNLPVVLEANGFDNYQWYKDGIAINGATSASLSVTSPGEYTAAGVLSGCLPSIQSFEVEIVLCPADVGIAKEVVDITNVSGSVFDVRYRMVVTNYSATNTADNLQIIDNLTSGLPSGATVNLQSAPQIISGTLLSGSISSDFDGTSDFAILQTSANGSNSELATSSSITIEFTARVDMTSASNPSYSSQAVVSTSAIGPNDGVSATFDSQDFSDNGSNPDPDGDGDPTELGENDATTICLSTTVINYDTDTYYTTGTDPTPTIVGNTGGTFSSTSGITLDPNTGQIDLDKTLVGTYTVTYSFGGLCSTTSTVTIALNPPNEPTVVSQISNSTRPTITGSAVLEAGETLRVEVNGITYSLGDGNLSISGTTWSLQIPGGNEITSDGTYNVLATIDDGSGGLTNDLTSSELQIDTASPNLDIQGEPTITNTTNSYTVTFEFSEDVVGFDFSDVSIANGSLSNFIKVDDNTYTAQVTPNGSGNIQISVASGSAQDAAGNTSGATQATTIYDITPPSAPTINSLTTNDTTPTITGAAEANSTVVVVVGGATFTITADASGNWSVDTETATPTSGTFTALTEGSHEVSVTSTDAAGNSTSDISNNEITVDLTNPSIPTISSLTTSDTTPILTGTAEANSIVTITIGGATFTTTANAGGNWTIDTGTLAPTSGSFTALSEGIYDIVVISTDAAGNNASDTSSDELTIDLTAPVSPTINVQVTNDNTPIITGTAEPNSTVTVTAGGATYTLTTGATGNWSVDTGSDTPTSGSFTPLSEGNNEVVVTSTDSAGNTTSDTSTNEITVDLTAPAAPTVNSQITNDTTPIITGTAEVNSTVMVVVGGVTYTVTADASGNWSVNTETATPTSGTFTALAEGNNEVNVTSTNSAGNTTSDTSTNEITVDLTAPATPTVNSQITNDDTPIITGTAEANSNVTVNIAGATFSTTTDASGNWSINTETATPTSGTFTPLAEGENEVSVTSTDTAGNATSDASSNEIIVDLTAPETPTINSQITNDTTPVVTGTAEAGSIVTINIGGATFTTTVDSNGNWSINTETHVPTSGSFTPLKEGNHEVSVTSTDTAGNATSDASSNEIIVDLTPPVVPTINSLVTSDNSPILFGTAEANSVVTIIVGGATFTTSADASGNWSLNTESTPISGVFTPLSEGSHEVVVSSSDEAGNTASDSTSNEIQVEVAEPDKEENPDSDGDGISDMEEDIDGDGDPSNDDTDGDGIPNYLDTDDDGDGIETADEDTGGDGDATNDDLDEDGIPDYLDNDVNGDGIEDSLFDVDGDGNPANDDTDGDGIPDYLDEDSDNDGIFDTDEDLDQDGDPTNDDSDGDGVPNYLDEDSDNDGTSDEEENSAENPAIEDNDGDDIPNYVDEDQDGDSIPDSEEDTNNDGNLNNDDCDADGIPNYLDSDECEESEEAPSVKPLKGFTPDGNGENDFFMIEGIEDYPNNHVQVFNRWGNRVFEVHGYNNQDRAWFGQAGQGLVLGGNTVPDGTYFYLVDLKNGSKPLSGFVVVKK